MTTVVIDTFAALGTVGPVKVRWELVDADGRPAPGTIDGQKPIVYPSVAYTDADGRLEVDVTPNESIQPDNTFWAVWFDDRRWQYLLKVPAGSGPVAFGDCQEDVPVALGSLAIDRVRGEPDGLAELDAAGRLPAGRLPEGVATDAAVEAVDQRIDGLGPADVGADPAGTAAGLVAAVELGGLADVDMTGLVGGKVPTWDGAKWVPGDPGTPDALTSSDVGTTVATPVQVSDAATAAITWTGPPPDVTDLPGVADLVTAHSDRDSTLELRAIRAALAEVSVGGAARIVILGDSITRRATWRQFARDLTALYNVEPMADKAGRRSPQTDTGGLFDGGLFDKRAGTWRAPIAGGVAPGSTVLALGDVLEHTARCDRITLMLGPGSLDVSIDGGTPVTVSHLAGGRWDSPALLLDEHTVTITALAAGSVVHPAYFHCGSYDQGVQVWDLGWSGGTTANFLDNNNDPILGVPATLGYVSAYIDPHLVIIATGTNDANTAEKVPNYATHLPRMVDWCRANLPDASVMIWVPPAATSRPWWPQVQQIARDTARVKGTAIIDSYTQLGDAADAGLDLVPDLTHPGPRSMPLISDLATRAVATRHTPLHVTSEPRWGNGTQASSIDLGAGYQSITLTGDWTPTLARVPLSGQARSVRVLVRSDVLPRTVTWPGEITWTGAAPTVDPSEWALVELTAMPDVGVAGTVLASGTWTPPIPLDSVDWWAAWSATDLAGVGDGLPVTSWDEMTGRAGLDLTESYGTSLWRAADPILGGQPSVDFGTGIGALRTAAGLAGGDQLTSPLSLIAILQTSSTVTQRAVNHVRGSARGLGVQAVGSWVSQGDATAGSRLLTAGSTGVPALLEAYIDGASSRFRVNGGTEVTGAGGADPITHMAIGGVWYQAAPANLWAGSVAFVGALVGDHASDTDWQALRGPLAARHGISLP